jgi:transcriptional regulator with XRE-family HTH domain
MKNLSKKAVSNIKKLLSEQTKTPETLAYEISMSKSFMYDFLNGKSDISLHNLQKIADGLEVKADELLK